MSYGIGKQKAADQSGKIKGKGTGTSDEIKKTVPSGSYIMPKDSTDAIGEENLARLGQPTDVNLSNGEYQLPPDQVHAVGVQALEQMKGQTHAPVDQPTVGFGIGGKEKPELFFANGGLVSPYPSADDIRKANRGTNVPSSNHAQDFIGRQTAQQAGGQPSTRGQTFEGQARNVTPESQPRNVTPTQSRPTPLTTSSPSASPSNPAPTQGGGIRNFINNSKLVKGGGALAATSALFANADTSSENYRERFGFGDQSPEDLGTAKGFAKDFGVRALGYASDLGNAMTLGQAGRFYADKQRIASEAESKQAAYNNQPQTPSIEAPKVAQVTDVKTQPNIQQQMNAAMYGQEQGQSQGKVQKGNDPYAIQQKGNSFSYANPQGAAQARTNGIPETQATGIHGGANDPKSVANFMANTREMGASQEQIDRAVQQSLNANTQGFGIRYPDRPQRTNEQEAERKNLLRQISAPIQGARGMTTNQRAQLMEMQQGEDNRATTMYNTDANNATSQFNNTTNNAANIAQTGIREQGSNDRAVLGENGQNMRYGMGLQQDREKFNREMSLTETKEGFGIRNAQRLEKLDEMYDEAETDEQRASIKQRRDRLTGAKEQSGKDRYMTVGGGQQWDDKAGGTLTQPQRLFDSQTRQFVDTQQGTPPQRAVGTISKVGDKTAVWNGANWVQQ